LSGLIKYLGLIRLSVNTQVALWFASFLETSHLVIYRWQCGINLVGFT